MWFIIGMILGFIIGPFVCAKIMLKAVEIKRQELKEYYEKEKLSMNELYRKYKNIF